VPGAAARRANLGAMLRLRLATPEDRAQELGANLDAAPGVSRLSLETGVAGSAVIEADVVNEAADDVVDALTLRGISRHDYVMTRLDVVASDRYESAHAPGNEAIAWVELLGRARSNSRPINRFLVLMAVAGVLAALGVVKGNAILIVGAMAVSPDLLPLSAACVGLVGRRPRIVRRAVVTLAIGLALAGLVALVLTLILDAAGALGDFRIGGGGLETFSSTDYSTVLIAAAAGVAAMLTFETRASGAVGVAISVTTMPAVAYWGVALGSGEPGAWGALLVLAVNVVVLLATGTATLAAQEWMARRAVAAERAAARPG